MNLKKYLAILPVLILVLGVGVVWLTHPEPEPQPKPEPIPTATQPDSISWGMSREDVKARVNAMPREESLTSILYDVPDKTTIEYHFRDEKLYTVTHRSGKYDTFEACLQEYQRLQRFLSGRYGQLQEVVSEKYHQSRWEVPAARTNALLMAVNEKPYMWILEFSERGENQ